MLTARKKLVELKNKLAAAERENLQLQRELQAKGGAATGFETERGTHRRIEFWLHPIHLPWALAESKLYMEVS
jgi:hypothetical protein